GSRLTDQPLQFSHFVAAGSDHGAIVALDPDIRAPQFPGEIFQPVQRGRRREQLNSRIAGEVHTTGPSHKNFPPLGRAGVMIPRPMRLTITGPWNGESNAYH